MTSPPPGVILLVEDNADDVFMVRHAFARTSISAHIVVARDGVEALDLLLPQDGREPLRPVIVLLDINMPRLGGLEVLTRLRADPRTRALPVVVLTSSLDDQDVFDSYHLGANSYIPKPVTPDEFLAAAQVLGVYWLDLNHQADPGPDPDSGPGS